MAGGATDSRQAPAGSPKAIARPVLRFAAYTLALGGALALLPYVMLRGGMGPFREGGLVEWVQSGALLLTACAFAFGAVRFSPFRQVFLLLALTATYALVREMDSPFEALIPWLGWKLPAALVVLCAVLVVWRKPRETLAEMGEFVTGRGFALLWVGLVVAILFAQLVGHGQFLRTLLGEDYTRDYKRVIEEIGELFGYLLVLIGSIESLVQATASGGASPGEDAAPDDE